MRQRGFTTMIYVGAAVAVLGIAAAMFFAAKSYVDKVRAEAHKAGRDEALLEVARRDNAQLTEAREKIMQLQAEKDAREAAHVAEVARIDEEGTNALRKVEAERDAARRNAARYLGRLRDPGRTATADASCSGGNRVSPAAPVASPGVDHGAQGTQGTELSLEAGEFLRAEADRADAVVIDYNAALAQLTACQAVLVADRGPK